MKKVITFILFLFFFSVLSHAQNVERPALYGIAKMTYRISNFDLAQSYYGEFLGFSKAFSYSGKEGTIDSYKINNRQFLEFVADKNASLKKRLVSVSFETENAQKMQEYLLSKGVALDRDVYIDGAGNKVLLTHDPSGIPIEFIQYMPGSKHVKSMGRFLSSERIATRIHHVGLYSKQMLENPEFYTQILGFQLILRIPEDRNVEPKLLYFRIPESAEMIEHYPSPDENFNHPCFVTMDMQETYSILRTRKKTEVLPPPGMGMGKRWLLNIWNQDGTKVEFTEPYMSIF